MIEKNFFNDNKHITMHPCTKFQLIWRTSNFGIYQTFTKKYEKVNRFELRT